MAQQQDDSRREGAVQEKTTSGLHASPALPASSRHLAVGACLAFLVAAPQCHRPSPPCRFVAPLGHRSASQQLRLAAAVPCFDLPARRTARCSSHVPPRSSSAAAAPRSARHRRGSSSPKPHPASPMLFAATPRRPGFSGQRPGRCAPASSCSSASGAVVEGGRIQAGTPSFIFSSHRSALGACSLSLSLALPRSPRSHFRWSNAQHPIVASFFGR